MMDPMTRDLIIRLRYQKAQNAPIADAQKQARELAKRQRDGEQMVAKATRERWREAMRLGREANRQERVEHRERLKRLAELKARRAAAMGVVGDFGRMGMRTAAVGGAIGLAAGVGLTKTLIDEARGAQNEWLGMTTLINSADSIVGGPLRDVNRAFIESRVLLDQLRVAAADTPGTFDDINTAFRDVVIPARMAGAEYKEIIKLASDMSTMTKVLGFDQGTVSRDVQQLLRGEMGDVQTPQLAAQRKEIAKLVQSGRSAEALAKMRSALAVPAPIMEQFSGGFDANFATLEDEWKSFAREAGKPILGWLTEELKSALKWVQENRAAVKRWAEDLGMGVVQALKDIKAFLAWMWEHREDIIGWAKWLAGAAGLAVIVTAVNGIVMALKGLIALAPALGVSMSRAFGPVVAAAAALGFLVDALGFEMGAVDTDKEVRAFKSKGPDVEDWYALAKETERLQRVGQEALGTTEFDFRRRPMASEGPGFFGGVNETRPPNPLEAMGLAASQAVADKLARVTNNIDARGARVNVNIDRVETDNPAMLARESLTAGFLGVAKQPIRARSRPGSVRLANGD